MLVYWFLVIIKVGVGIYWVWYRNDILCQDTCHGQCLFLVTLELFICASNLLGKTAEGVRLTTCHQIPPSFFWQSTRLHPRH